VIVHLDPSSPVPPYEQLRGQVAAAIGAGRLGPGHRLPPIRQLAADLGLAPGTVARAYRELEAAGLVRSQGRRGTRVVDDPPPVSDPPALARLAEEYLARATALGVAPEEALHAVREACAAATA
jgi:GntR family transcriptional regulator